MTTKTPSQIQTFITTFQSLLAKKGSDIKREARLLDLRFRLTLDLQVKIETQYSDTKTKCVKETYEILFKFLDLWNVYELCKGYGKVLNQSSNNKWNDDFLTKSGIKDFLLAQANEFKNQFLATESDIQKYKDYLSHFAELSAITENNKEKYQNYISTPVSTFDYNQLLFIQYMERNAYYHGGEAARAGIDYGYRQKQIAFYIDFLTQFIALLGSELFTIEEVL